jgi:hypothetical protein
MENTERDEETRRPGKGEAQTAIAARWALEISE